MEEKQFVHFNMRIPKRLKDLIVRYVEMDAHQSISDFGRDAMREKIQRDAPELYSTLFQLKKKKGE